MAMGKLVPCILANVWLVFLLKIRVNVHERYV